MLQVPQKSSLVLRSAQLEPQRVWLSVQPGASVSWVSTSWVSASGWGSIWQKPVTQRSSTKQLASTWQARDSDEEQAAQARAIAAAVKRVTTPARGEDDMGEAPWTRVGENRVETI